MASGKIEIPEALPARWKRLLAGLLRADYTERWRKREIERWQNTLGFVADQEDTDTKPATQVARSRPRPSQDTEHDSSSSMPETPGSLPTVEENKTPILSRPSLVRKPETIALQASDVAEVIFNGALTTFSRFFWLAFLVDWESHNAWAGILFLGTVAALGIGIHFLPNRLERVKREVRVNRQLAKLSSEDQRFLRRLVRRWMRSLRRESREERRGRVRGRHRDSLISR